MKKSLFKLTFLILLISSFQSQATGKRVFGFLGDWHNGSYYTANGVQYEYMTDLAFAFILPQSNGSFGFDINASTWYSRLSSVVASAHAKNVKVHVSAGGWGSSSGVQGPTDPIHVMCNNETARTTFVNNVLNLIETYDLDGFNMDWEYPADTDADVLDELLLALKLGMIDLESKMNKTLELSVAVGAGSHGTAAYTMNAISVCDLVMIMAFDNAATHHSTLGFATNSMDYWLNNKGVGSYQLILGVPFYSQGSSINYSSYAWFSNGDPAGFYNDADGSMNGYEYNSRPVLEEKITEMQNRGGQGVFVWEIAEDRTDQYSLLKVLHDNVVSAEEVSNELTGVTVYPNPFSNELNFTLSSSDLVAKEVKYSVSDITGKKLKEGALTQISNKINAEEITTAGIYFITVTNNENQTATFKFVKK